MMKFPKKYKSPDPNWKKWIGAFLIDNREKVEREKKPPKPIKQIGARKTAKIKDGSQPDLFLKLWDQRKHSCEICGASISEPLSFVFAHRLSKGRYPEYIHNSRNISLVCSIDCHHELDSILAHNDQDIINFIENKQPAIFRNLIEKLKKNLTFHTDWDTI